MKGVIRLERTIKRVIFPASPPARATNVAAYARVSTGKDAMLHSLSSQVSYYSDFIQQHPGWIYCGVYSDEALSGTKEDRAGFQQMLEACREGHINMIMTKSISRFARNTVTLLETVRELKNLGVDVFFEEQNIHTLSIEGELMLTILASYAQEESRSASENQKWRIRQSFAKGELLNWRFMIGYDINRNGIRIDPDGAKTVQDVFRRFLNGESLSSIARHLNSNGITGIFGGRWKHHHIRRLLSNEKLTGNALLQKHYRNNHIEKKRVTNRGELPMYFAEGTHPAIISQETFDAAKARLDEISATSVLWSPPTFSAFSGIIVCTRCGHTYRRIKNHGRFAWNCSTYQSQGKSACPAQQIREDVLMHAAAMALGLPEYNDEAFRDKISSILAKTDHTLEFVFKDGHRVLVPWRTPSRSTSWNSEMRKAASKAQLLRRIG